MEAQKRIASRVARFILVQRIGFLSFMLLACVGGWFVTNHHQSKIVQQSVIHRGSSSESSTHSMRDHGDLLYETSFDNRSNRIVYPYSVIPGGIRNVLELKNAIANDPVIATHYSGFRIDRARIVILDRTRAIHVSYRIGNQVYWTKRQVNIAKGELLITDGVHTARTRCGNQIAELMPVQVSEKEPSPEQLDTPIEIGINTPSRAANPETLGPIPVPTISKVPPTGETPPNDPSSPVLTNPTPYVPLPGPPPVVHVPEPGTAFLLLTAFPVIAFLRNRYGRGISK